MTNLRAQLEAALVDGDAAEARECLIQLWAAQPGPAAAGVILRAAARLPRLPHEVDCRIHLLRSFTVEPAVPLLRAGAWLGGIRAEATVGAFNAYAQAILDPGSTLNTEPADVIILAVRLEELVPELAERYAADPAAAAEAVDRAGADLTDWLRLLRQRSTAMLVVHSFAPPVWPALGLADRGQQRLVRRLNEQLEAVVDELPGAHLLDYDALTARFGRERWHSQRNLQVAGLPLANDAVGELAAEWLRFVHAAAGRLAKVLVCDLDNTLWGGVIGEVGTDGIALGPAAGGAPFRQVQQAIGDLSARGVLLAVASRNNPGDALQALADHPEMLLRPEQFAALRLSWQPKSVSLREIAAELNVGTEALAFLDDNPAERAQVRRELPEVTVIELPDDPGGFAAALRRCPALDRVALASEDRQRQAYYAAGRQRAELAEASGSLEDFYRSLRQEVTIAPAAPGDLPRVAQLLQKTNQFNLTTRRHSAAAIAEFAAATDWLVLTCRVADRFGENGLVGVAMVQFRGSIAHLDTLLLSCRVIGRTVETALLAELAAQATARGAGRLEGWFLPTAKNAPAAEVYPRHGFTLASEDGAATLWARDLPAADLTVPAWITLRRLAEV